MTQAKLRLECYIGLQKTYMVILQISVGYDINKNDKVFTSKMRVASLVIGNWNRWGL